MFDQFKRKFHAGMRLLRQRLQPGPRVLLYHRVLEHDADPQLLAVTPRHFAEQLEILRRKAFPMSLPSLLNAVQQGNAPRNAVAITFDDGYADNLHQAKPLLERYEVPATVFVATGQLGTREEFWWDELDRLLLQPGSLPVQIQLTIAGQTLSWYLGNAANYTLSTASRHAGWSVADHRYPSRRHQLYATLCAMLRPLPYADQRQALEQLRQWAGETAAGRPSHRVLSAMETAQLAGGGLVEVGAHTITHAYLSTLPAFAQRQEIVGSRIYLEEIVGTPITSFSYPFGTPVSATGTDATPSVTVASAPVFWNTRMLPPSSVCIV